MCGRFTMTWRDKTELATMLGIPEREIGDYTPRFNIAPTQPYFVLKTTYESREAIPATWGLVNSWLLMPAGLTNALMRKRRPWINSLRIARHLSGGVA
jgi:putative SOS response-associated peptidase YedK